jgi:hypothetical protein
VAAAEHFRERAALTRFAAERGGIAGFGGKTGWLEAAGRASLLQSAKCFHPIFFGGTNVTAPT